ncbi:MAG TPA: methanol/ethanol family PQQ-dependent dehydrogenase [Bryobacteraceae bacterium]|nr:methanol/ethanol family PQQ-dependent dehydrogenase [Bryobacteraceae bacterium]
MIPRLYLPLCGLGLSCLTIILSGCASQPQSESTNAAEAADWTIPLGSYSAIRHSSLKQIDKTNADKMKMAWSMSTGTLRGQEGQPLVVGNMMYFESSYPNYVYAVDLDNVGKIVWKFAPEQDKFAPSVACCDVVNRGVAYGDGKILAAVLDTKLYALDAKTGQVVWTATNGDPKLGQTMTSAPLVVHDKVIVGIAGGEYGVRGYMTAYDIKTGKQVWRAYNVGPDQDILVDPQKTLDGATGQPVGANSSVKTWRNDEWKLGGGTTWGWYTYDPQLNLVYYGSGNPGTWNPTQRPGDNKWSTSLFARNPDTGVAAWAYQMTPHDEWDYDGINEGVLSDSSIDGQTVPTITHFDRNGFAYVLDRRNGKLLRANKFDPSTNWAKEIDLKTGRPVLDPAKETHEDVNVKDICPAAQGAKNHQPASYDPRTKLFYVGTNHICMDYQAFGVKYKGGFPYVGAILSMYPADHGNTRGRLIAYDSVSGQTKWSVDDMFQVYSGPLTTDGDVVFYGTLDGWFKAVDEASGKELYKFHAPSGIIGNPMTYTYKGKQYVAVLSGVGGWAAIGLAEGLTKGTEGLGAVGLTTSLADYTNLGGTLLVFSL